MQKHENMKCCDDKRELSLPCLVNFHCYNMDMMVTPNILLPVFFLTADVNDASIDDVRDCIGDVQLETLVMDDPAESIET